MRTMAQARYQCDAAFGNGSIPREARLQVDGSHDHSLAASAQKSHYRRSGTTVLDQVRSVVELVLAAIAFVPREECA